MTGAALTLLGYPAVARTDGSGSDAFTADRTRRIAQIVPVFGSVATKLAPPPACPASRGFQPLRSF